MELAERFTPGAIVPPILLLGLVSPHSKREEERKAKNNGEGPCPRVGMVPTEFKFQADIFFPADTLLQFFTPQF